MLLRLLGDDVRDVGVVRVEREREAEAGGEAVAVEALPVVAAVVRAVDAAVVLLPDPLRLLGMHQQLVHALPDVGIWVRHELRRDVLVDRGPGVTAVLAPEGAGSRDGDVHGTVDELNRVSAHAPSGRLPAVARRMLEQPLVQLPRPAAVAGAEQDAGVAAEPQLRVAAGLDVPRRVELELAVLGEAQLVGALPALAAVGRTMRARAVERVVRGGMERAVTRVDDRVVDRPALQQRALDLPLRAVV